jgi:succinate dehydrogenase / fumarate reductase cytochrome b subunit
MPDMSARQRPLSPHLQVYKPQLTTATSIGHRISGVLLCGFALIMSWGLVALAGGQKSYEAFVGFMTGTPGRIMAAVAVVVFVYHFLNGLRHLAWDTGWGLDLKRAYATGYAVLGLTPVLSALVLWLLWG